VKHGCDFFDSNNRVFGNKAEVFSFLLVVVLLRHKNDCLFLCFLSLTRVCACPSTSSRGIWVALSLHIAFRSRTIGCISLSSRNTNAKQVSQIKELLTKSRIPRDLGLGQWMKAASRLAIFTWFSSLRLHIPCPWSLVGTSVYTTIRCHARAIQSAPETRPTSFHLDVVGRVGTSHSSRSTLNRGSLGTPQVRQTFTWHPKRDFQWRWSWKWDIRNHWELYVLRPCKGFPYFSIQRRGSRES